MKAPSHSDAYRVLLLQAADDGRGPILFGDSLERARMDVLPFLVGEEFPSVYLEFPLGGDPFLDVTLLYNDLEPGTRVASPMAGEHAAVFDWFAQARQSYSTISFGFEVDTEDPSRPCAAVHFQPRASNELVRPFFEALGEARRADLYLNQAARMPEGWPLAFFGLFRGRPDSPLRVCGYLDSDEQTACANDPAHIAACFDRIGFTAYTDAMLIQVAQVMDAAPSRVDFQFDVFPDGSLSPIFAIDAQFGIEQPEAVQASFENGPSSRFVALLEAWGIADDRWKLGVQSTFARSLPAERADGSLGKFAFTLMPQWAKVRWIDGELQTSKLYLFAHAGLLDKKQDSKGDS